MDRGTGGTATLIARPPRELDDHALVAEVRRGADAAFEALYERYRRRITAYVKGMVSDHGRAEDTTQEVFVSALRRMRETERPIAFKPWIYEIARNACIDQHRRTKRTNEVSYDADQALGSSDHLRLVAPGPTPDAAVETKQQLHHLCGAIGGLSQSHHEILVLRELEGMSYREIGDRMSLSRAAVESTLFRARRRLTEEYEDLVSGRRCVRVQAIIGAAAEGMLGARDSRRMARHVSYCQTCRHHARRLGVQDVKLARPLGSRLAALLPVPAFLRIGRGGSAESAAGWSTQASSSLAQWAAAASPAVEPVTTGWSKAATVVTMAAVGMGAGVSSHSGAINQLTPGARSQAARAPALVRVVEPRRSVSPLPARHAGSVLATAAGQVPAAPASAAAGTSQRGGGVVRLPGRARPGRVRSTVSTITGGRTGHLPVTPVRLPVQAPVLSTRGQEHGVSTPVGLPLAVSTPIGGAQARGAAPDPPPASLSLSLRSATSVVGAPDVAGTVLEN